VAEALAAPRIHHQWLPNVLRVERFGAAPEVVRMLQMMGHDVRLSPSSRSQGRVMAIFVDPKTGLRLGAADPRDDDSAAIGY
jgi:gamma-glutamyltranspeptidase/glutathione hydrolase